MNALLELPSIKISELISQSPYKNGCYSIFIKLSKNIGLKLYKSAKNRDSCFLMQDRASIEDLGPDTFGTIDNITFEKENYFGYFTEVVKVIENIKKKTFKQKEKLLTKYEDEIDYLSGALEKIGFDFKDFHLGNIGWKNENMICIDFDDTTSNSLEYLNKEDNF